MPLILKALVGKGGLLTDVVMGKKTIADVVTGLVAELGGGAIADKVIAALAKLGLYYPSKAALNAAVYVKVFGSEIAAFGLWEKDIRGFVGTDKWITAMIGKILTVPAVTIDTLKAIALVDNTIAVPTPAGFPLAIKLDVVALMHVKGKATFTGIQAITELITGAAVTTPITGAIDMAATLVLLPDLSIHLSLYIYRVCRLLYTIGLFIALQLISTISRIITYNRERIPTR